MNKNILPIIAIAGNIKIAKALSEKFAGEKSYFAIMEEPWVSRIDADNEVKRRTNFLALIPHAHLVLAGCKEKTCHMLVQRFPPRYRNKVIIIKDESSIDESIRPILKYSNPKNPKNQYIDYQDISHLNSSEKIGVIEKSNSLGEIIAENFCLANGYKILKIECASRELVDEYEDLLRDWNCAQASLLRNEAKQKLFRLLKSRTGDLENKNFHHVVFFTRGIPYGILPFKSPVAHLFLERDLGLQILRGYCKAFEENPGIALALICDPGEIPDSESVKIKKILLDINVEIVDLSGAEATTYRFMHLIERYPYDFCMISSHAGEVDGRRITEEFISPKGIRYKVVYDLYATFAPTPWTDEVKVQELIVPISINDIPWSDKKKMKEDSQTKNFMLAEFLSRDKDRRKPLKTEDCGSIKFSNALKLYKFSWFPALHTVGEMRFPIIFNNACSSWIQMAKIFIFAGALVYIGTTKDISTGVASVCGSRFVELATKKRSMLYALFQIQEAFTKQLGYSPYLYWGFPDAELRPTFSDKKKLREKRVRIAVNTWRKKLRYCHDEDMKKTIKSILGCILEVG